MKKADSTQYSKSKVISYGGLFAALSAVFQLAPVLMPVFGLALSPLSTVPIALIACISPYAGIVTYMCASAIIIFVSFQEALIFIFSTGLLGLSLGLLTKKRTVFRISIAALALFCGINILFFVCKINVFGPVTEHIADYIEVFFFLFSAVYTTLWSILLKVILKVSMHWY